MPGYRQTFNPEAHRMRTGIRATLLLLLMLPATPAYPASQSYAEFDIVYQDRDSSQISGVAESLTNSLRAIQSVLGLSLRNRITARLCSPTEFARIAPVVAASGSMAFYSLADHAIILVYGWTAMRSTASDRNDAVLRHELTHAVLRSYARTSVPRWFSEGLATYMEVGRDGVAQQRLRVQADARRNILTPMEHGDHAPYDVGVVAVDYLMERYGPAVIAAIVTPIAAGATFAAAFQQAVGLTPEAYERAFREAMR